MRLGPTEFRAALVGITALLVAAGTGPMKSALPYVAAGSLAALCVLVYRTQKQLWRRDMERKAGRSVS